MAVLLAVAVTASRYQGIYLVTGLVVTLTPLVLAVLLTRTTDVHSARRRNSGPCAVDRPWRERLWGRSGR